MPGWCPEVHAVGPFRSITRIESEGLIRVCALDATLQDDIGMLGITLELSHFDHDHAPGWLQRFDTYKVADGSRLDAKCATARNPAGCAFTA